MRFWASLQRKNTIKNACEGDLKVTLLADVLSAGSDSRKYRNVSSLPLEPIDPRQALYGEKTNDS
jgi:hypothetical protein